MTTPTKEEVRRHFEAWAREQRMSVERNVVFDYYVDDVTQDAWLGYQASLSSPAVVALVEALEAAEELHRVGLFNAKPGQIDSVIELRTAALAPFTTGAGHVE